MKTKMKPSIVTRKAATKVPPEQWKMPVSMTVDGSPVSLKDYIRSEVPALSLSQLSLEQKANLTAKRIELQPKFELSMIGAGIVDKKRAISEVKAMTPIGRVMVEIEQRLITNLVEQAKQEVA